MSQTKQTRQILAHLSGKIGSLPNEFSPAGSHSGRRLLVLFSGNPRGYEEVLKDLLKLKQGGWTFDLAFSANADALMNSGRLISQLSPVQLIGRDMQELKRYKLSHLSAVIAPLVTQNTARKLTLGIQDGLVPNLLWQALWDGIPVFMNLESLKTYHGRPTTNLAQVKLIQQTIDQLREMGVMEADRPLDLLHHREIDSLQQDTPSVQAESTCYPKAKVVITEQDIQSYDKTVTGIEISADTIVTPLARDTAAARGIRFHRK